jgi:hypothetical protein
MENLRFLWPLNENHLILLSDLVKNSKTILSTRWIVMKLKLKLLKVCPLLFAVFFTGQLFALGTGLSTYPLPNKSGALTTEFSSFFSKGSGVGLQVRYIRKFNQIYALEANLGASDSERSKRFGLAGDIEIFPDVNNRPRFVVRPFLERSTEYGRNYNIIGAYPILSKGYVFRERTGYPFVALPIQMAFSSEESSYDFRMGLTFGMTGKLPLHGYDHFLYNLEGNINITDTPYSLLIGLSYPL